MAQSAGTLGGPSEAWGEWSERGFRNRVDGLDSRPGRPQREGPQGTLATAKRAGAIAEIIAKGLGLATGAATGDDAGKTLTAISAELGRRGMPRSRSVVDAIRRALEGSGLLDPSDGDGQPRVPAGNPTVPSACEGHAACTQCYARAIDDMDSTRLRLEKLRSIYTSTYRYGKNHMAFADGVSAMHGVAALTWQARKVDVLKSLKNLDRAYDSKYEELITQLHTDLQGYSRCESEVMHVPDWFNRFGFVYYQFMKDHYKRPSL